MEIKLDKNDRKILCELSKNARTNTHNIAKRTHLSRQVVDYRIKKMERSGIIKKYRLSLNYSELGYSTCAVFLNMRNFSSEDEIEFKEFLVKNPDVAWAGLTSGNWDFFIYVYYKNLQHLDGILSNILEFKKDKINDKEILPIIRKYCLNIMIGDLKYGLRETSSKYQRDIGSFESLFRKRKTSFGKIKLDNIDSRIIEILDENCKTPLTNIAKELKINKDTVSYRIKKLIEADIIKNFIISIDFQKLSYNRYMIFLELENLNEEDKIQIKNYLQNNVYVHFAGKTFGRKNLLIELYCKTAEDFAKALLEIRNFLSDKLKTYNSLQILSEIKLHKASKEFL